MMSAPAIVGSLLSVGKDAIQEGVTFGSDLPAVLVGMVVAGVSGYLAIRFFMKVISKASLNGFALYMALLGIAVIVLQATGVLTDPAPAVSEAAALLKGLLG